MTPFFSDLCASVSLWCKRLLGFLRRRKLDVDMAAEMRAHVEEQTRRNVAAGMSPDDARAAAHRQFGGVVQIQERARDERAWVWLDQLRQDVRYAARGLRQRSGFTLTVVLTLGLGLGVNAALFTVYNALALRPLPVREPEELVVMRRPGSQPVRISYPLYQEFRHGSDAFSGLAAWTNVTMRLSDHRSGGAIDSRFEVHGDGMGAAGGFVSVRAVSDNYFAVLQADLALGRDFLPEESRAPGGPRVIVLQYRFWQQQFDRDRGVLGETVSLNGTPYVIVGVTTEDFIGHEPAPPVGWVPLMTELTPDALVSRNNRVSVIGRLKPGVALTQAHAELKLIAGRVASSPEEHRWAPPLDRGMKFMQIPISTETIPIFAPVVVGFFMVLLIACSNVANLMLARGLARQQEIGVRLTLGASRGRVLRQLLVETFLLCTAAAITGLVLAQWTLHLIQPRLPVEWGLPGGTRQWQALSVAMDHRVILAMGGLAVFATLAAGLLPALHASRSDLISAMKESGRLFNREIGRGRLRNLYVITQVAGCLMLLSCAGLLGRNMLELRKLDVGLDVRSAFSALLGGEQLASPQREVRAAASRRALETVRELPGVAAACQFLGGTPLDLGAPNTTVVPRDPSGADPGPQTLRYRIVSSGFFETFRLPLLQGRTFSTAEIEHAAPVVIISESAAQRLWPGQEALGRKLAVDAAAFAWPPGNHRGVRECMVIGVARDVRGILREKPAPMLYVPLTAAAGEAGVLYVRPKYDSAAALADLTQSAAREGLTLILTERLEVRGGRRLAPFVALGWVSGALGILALVMAAVGLGGVMAFAVNQRVREIGIRVALGATTARVVGLFVRQGMKLVVIGTVIGLTGGALIALALQKILFGLGHAFDALTLLVVTVVLGAVAMLACWLPARRAAKVDPVVALRAE